MITYRCLQNRLRVSPDAMKLVKHIGHSSKNVYNTGVFGYKKFMELHDLQLDYYCNHLDEYLHLFSPNDRIIVGRKLCLRGEFDKMKRLVRSSHIGETDLRNMLNDPHTLQENPVVEGSTLMGFDETYKFINRHESELNALAKTNTHLIEFIKDIKPIILNKFENLKNITPIISDDAAGVHMKMNIVMMKTPDSTILENYVASKCSSYRQMASQSAQQTIKRVMQSFSSYFALRESENMVGERVSLPQYLDKKGYYNIIFQNKTFTVPEKLGESIRLSIGKLLKNEYKATTHAKKTNIADGYIYIDYPPRLFEKKINEIELIPRHHGRWFEVKFSYEHANMLTTFVSVTNTLTVELNPTEKKKRIAEEKKRVKQELARLKKLAEKTKYEAHEYASIDLGVVNLATVYIPTKHIRPLIISGRELIVVNNNTRSVLSKLSKKYKKYTDKHYKALRWRENRIDNLLHTASRIIIEHLKRAGVKKLVIGYNTNWKQGINLGRKTNDTFYKIPFRNFINQLFYKGLDAGIDVVESNESFTSKCDALNNEHIGFHEVYSGKREKRGLFRSAVGAVINADVNGAINILRKYTLTIGQTIVQKVMDTVAETHQLLKSPLKFKIINKTDINTIDTMAYIARCVVKGGRDYPNRVRVFS